MFWSRILYATHSIIKRKYSNRQDGKYTSYRFFLRRLLKVLHKIKKEILNIRTLGSSLCSQDFQEKLEPITEEKYKQRLKYTQQDKTIFSMLKLKFSNIKNSTMVCGAFVRFFLLMLFVLNFNQGISKTNMKVLRARNMLETWKK